MKDGKFCLSNYTKNGVAFPLPALSAMEAQEAYLLYMDLCESGKVTLEGEKRVFGHLLHSWIADLVSHPAILAAVRSVIGENILTWVSEFNTKAPDSAHFFSWHQDLYYWRHEYDDPSSIPMVTVWLALSPANEENGGMRAIPGSHTQLVQHESKPCTHNLLTRAQEVKVEIDETQAIPINLAPGEFSIHHPLIHHASAPNKSIHPRVGLVIRYMAPEIVPPQRPAYAWLISGEDEKNNWNHVAPLDVTAGVDLRQKCIQSVQKITGSRFK
jgi:non-heme Fe2+,alpha-ketoglutarate-dependent halogenase